MVCYIFSDEDYGLYGLYGSLIVGLVRFSGIRRESRLRKVLGNEGWYDVEYSRLIGSGVLCEEGGYVRYVGIGGGDVGDSSGGSGIRLRGDDDVFEALWLLYGRKGSKARSLSQWRRLGMGVDVNLVRRHIEAYCSVREFRFRLDFERYLGRREYMNVVYNSVGSCVYDPTVEGVSSGVYCPKVDGFNMRYDEGLGMYCVLNFNGRVYDGYNDEDRPIGAYIYCSGVVYEWKGGEGWVRR